MKPLDRAVEGLLSAAEIGHNNRAKALANQIKLARQKRGRGRPQTDAPKLDELLRDLAGVAIEFGTGSTKSLGRQILRGLMPRERGEHARLLVDDADPLARFVVWDGLNDRQRKDTTLTAIANTLASSLGANRKTVMPLVEGLVTKIETKNMTSPIKKPRLKTHPQGRIHRCR